MCIKWARRHFLGRFSGVRRWCVACEGWLQSPCPLSPSPDAKRCPAAAKTAIRLGMRSLKSRGRTWDGTTMVGSRHRSRAVWPFGMGCSPSRFALTRNYQGTWGFPKHTRLSCRLLDKKIESVSRQIANAVLSVLGLTKQAAVADDRTRCLDHGRVVYL
ncbi:hypothetical protein IF1G_02619 [Cordyceps javanica]|uniref:Uncharacterized protein n=1 Tax=Cordyceps javanica TaxID=43265 RepID=A0A545VAB2_9HYPO|nr:hypothetical protein IF1G_02619 [Cordyceps javanica]